MHKNNAFFVRRCYHMLSRLPLFSNNCLFEEVLIAYEYIFSYNCNTCQRSSVVEQRLHKAWVAGPNPAAGTHIVVINFEA